MKTPGLSPSNRRGAIVSVRRLASLWIGLFAAATAAVQAAELPVVSIRATRALTSEPNPVAIVPPGEFRVVRSGPIAEPLKVWLRFGGTATAGKDYAELGAEAVIPAGKEAVVLEVLALADDLVEGSETVVAVVRPPPADCPEPDCKPYRVGPQSAEAKVVIEDMDRWEGPPIVSLVVIDDEARELLPTVNAFDPARFRLERTGDAAQTLAVFFSVKGTATAGRDYRELGHSVLFQAGAQKAELDVLPIDDFEVEGDETVVVTLEPDPSMGPIEHYRIHPEQATARAVIHDNDFEPVRPVIRIETTAAETPEYCPPNARCMPGRFLISRTGPMADAQPVFLLLAGTAKNGVDYREVPFLAVIPAGESSVDVIIGAKDDELVEGDESVIATVSECPPAGFDMPCVAIQVDPAAASATAWIIDNERPGTEPRLEILQPKDGATFAVGDVVRIEALAVDPAGFIARLDYYANGAKIGESSVGWPECVGCEPKPGDPAKHVFEWKGPAAGRYELVAKATHRLVFEPQAVEQPLDPPLVSEPVGIRVGEPPPGQRVSIAATRMVAEETAYPYRRLALTGEFTISREGDLTLPVVVFVHYDGSAVNGVDCERLPWMVTIPAGEKSAVLEVKAIPDNTIEGTEKLIARLAPCPPRTDPPLGPPCVAVVIDPNQAEAAVTICDDARCGEAAIVKITAPPEGARFALGRPIEINAVAIDPLGAITRLEFWADEKQVGESEIVFIRAPDPGTPISHELVWKEAPAGPHILTARGLDSAGMTVVSGPISITVEDPDALRVAILKPRSGAVFTTSDTVKIQAVATGRGIVRLDVLADERLLDSTKEPEITVSWNKPPAGPHVLTARAVDAAGVTTMSDPVRILVREDGGASFVERDLPPAYAPERPFVVTLLATPPRLANAWAVADQPPAGWKVDEISHDGAFDPAHGQVKFGPFTELQSRRLTYRLTPPADASGRHEFTGEAALDGQVVPIAGDRTIGPAVDTHPADLAAKNSALDIAEVTAYAAAWKEGKTWSAGPVPIPLSYVTRAGFLWKRGERYAFAPDHGLPPECWVPAAGSGVGILGAGSPLALRSLAGPVVPGSAVEVRIMVMAGTEVAAYGVEELIPEGWTFESANAEARFDTAQRQVRWGPFFSAEPQTLSYRVVPPAGMASYAALVGVASFDGRNQPIMGTKALLAEDAATAIRFHGIHAGDHGMRLEVSGSPGQICHLESSTDLINWVPHHTVFVLEDGVVEVEDDAPAAGARFFRVRP